MAHSHDAMKYVFSARQMGKSVMYDYHDKMLKLIRETTFQSEKDFNELMFGKPRTLRVSDARSPHYVVPRYEYVEKFRPITEIVKMSKECTCPEEEATIDTTRPFEVVTVLGGSYIISQGDRNRMTSLRQAFSTYGELLAFLKENAPK